MALSFVCGGNIMRKKTIILSVCIMLVLTLIPFSPIKNVTVEAGYFVDGVEYNYRKRITINHNMVSDDLYNFPILVSVIDSDLTVCQPDGNDISFKKDKLIYNHEIEYFDSSIGKLFAWVNVTYISSSTDTNFYMYYGNSTCISQENIEDTWDSDYVMVQHMSGSSYDTIDDSTRYSNDVMSEEGDAVLNYQSPSISGFGLDMGEGDKSLNIPMSDSLKLHNYCTIESWIYYRYNLYYLEQLGIMGVWYDGTPTRGYMTHINSVTKNIIFDCVRNYKLNATDVPVVEDSWNYIVGRWGHDSNTMNVFRNSTKSSDSIPNSETIPTITNNFQIGHIEGTTQNNINGIYDELRLSKIERSDAWIVTTYNTISSPSTFLSFGSQEQTPNANFNYNPLNPLERETVSFIDSSITYNTNIVAWQWDFGDGYYSDIRNPVHQYYEEGAYLINLTVIDNYGFTGKIIKNIIVGENMPPDADFSYTPSEPTDLQKVYFTDNSHDTDGYIDKWFWEFGDGKTSMNQNPEHQYNDDGIYTINLTVWDEKDRYNMISKDINILNVKPCANIDGQYAGTLDDPPIFNASGSYDEDGFIVNYTWDFGDGTIGHGEKTTHVYQNTGEYQIILYVEDDNGAADNTISIAKVYDQRQEQYDYCNPIYQNQYSAQSFKTSLKILTKVDLLIGMIENEVRSPTLEGVVVSIRNYLEGPDLTKILISVKNIPNQPDWIECDFPDLRINPDKTKEYYIVIKTLDETNSDYYMWRYGYHTSYSDGIMLHSVDAGDSWEQKNNFDFCFRTHGIG